MIELKREEQKLLLFKDDELYLKLGFEADEFVCIINKNEPLIIKEEYNIFFYNKIKELMNNNYIFADKFSIKTDDKLVWLSDQHGDLEDEYETDKMSRFVIEKKDNQFILYSYKPIFQKYNIERPLCNIFSPSRNGRYSFNEKTNRTFQNDFVFLYQSLCENLEEKGFIKKLEK